ncbi:hypothetical protein D3C72_1359190 [compost metagenome]
MALGPDPLSVLGAALSHKDSRSTVVRTVYGKVTVNSPRLWSWRTPRCVVHPLSKALTNRATPELEYLQAKWASHLPYRQATAMLKEVLPLDKGIFVQRHPGSDSHYWKTTRR